MLIKLLFMECTTWQTIYKFIGSPETIPFPDKTGLLDWSG